MGTETRDGDRFRRRVESDASASLALLDSAQFLRAAAGGDPTPAALLEAAAASEHAARETFVGWAADERDADAHAAFSAVAEQERDHRERVASELADWTPDAGPPGPMHAYLRGRDATVERIAGGLVGRPLVTLRTHARLIAFFEARDDDRRARLFSELRAETAAVLDDGLALLEAHCGSESAWETARLVAGYTIQVAADDTADALRALGVEPAIPDE
ncbi:rubrerythrin family protein [Halobellus sp. Atlit-31R]|nr:rubrerythrin family protein [Halobellus sp. Atlit-31R]